MGRKLAGATPREHRVNFRLNDAENADLETGRARRGLEVSDYFRTLLEEDTRGDQS